MEAVSDTNDAWAGLRKTAPLVCCVVVVALACFVPGLTFDFVGFDDYGFIVHNPNCHGLSWANLKWMWTDTVGHYHPLTWMSHGLDYELWGGMDPFGFHLTNWLLHGLNTGLVCVLFWVLLGVVGFDQANRGAAAMVGALLFAVHPLRAESVVWVTERRDLLSLFFLLLAVLAYLRAVLRQGSKGLYLGIAAAMHALSLLSKAWGITLVVVLLLLDIYPLRRWQWKRWRALLYEKLGFIVLGLMAGGLAFFAQHGTAMVSNAEHSPIGRVLQAGFSLCFYLSKTLLPVGLSPLYELRDSPTLADTPFVCALVVAGVLTLCALVLARRYPGVATSWLVFGVVISPVSGLAQSGVNMVSDGYSYIATLPFALLVGAALWKGSSRWLSAVASSLVVCSLVAVTVPYTTSWRDTPSLWKRVIAYDPACKRAHLAMGNWLARNGQWQASFEILEKRYGLSPWRHEFLHTLGENALQAGYYERAIGYLGMLRLLWPQDLTLYEPLATAYEHDGRSVRAQEVRAEGLQIARGLIEETPDHVGARLTLGAEAFRGGRLGEAIEHFDWGLRAEPDSAELLFQRAGAHAGIGDLRSAFLDYGRSLELAPKDSRALNSRANLWRQVGNEQAALADLNKALVLNPSSYVARINRASVRLSMGEHAAALADVQEAVRVAPTEPKAFAVRATVWEALGDRDQAMADVRKAIGLCRNAGGLRFQLTSWLAELEAIDD